MYGKARLRVAMAYQRQRCVQVFFRYAEPATQHRVLLFCDQIKAVLRNRQRKVAPRFLRVELLQLKGHKTVGGMRASIYNAMPLQGVQALVTYMQDFARRHG